MQPVRTIQDLATLFAQGLDLVGERKKFAFEIVGASRGISHLTFSARLYDPTLLDKIMNEKVIESMALTCGVYTIQAYRDRDIVKFLFTLPKDYWQECDFSSTRGLGVGLGDERIQVNHHYDIPHSIVAGTTGSGKTVAVQAITLATIREYQEVDFIICDPHRQFLPLEMCPLMAFPLAHEQKDIVAALEAAFNIYAKRKNRGWDENKDRRLIVVIDEAQEVIVGQAIPLLERLTSGGRKYGISCIVATQKPSEKALPNILGNLGIKYVGLVTDATASSNLTGHAGLACHKLRGDGEFVRVYRGRPTKFQMGMVYTRDFESIVPTGERPSSLQERSVPARPASVDAHGNGSDTQPPLGRDRPLTVNEAMEQYVGQPKAAPGRPRKELDPGLLVKYLTTKVSVTEAKRNLGLSQAMHGRYESYTQSMRSALKQQRGGV